MMICPIRINSNFEKKGEKEKLENELRRKKRN